MTIERVFDMLVFFPIGACVLNGIVIERQPGSLLLVESRSASDGW